MQVMAENPRHWLTIYRCDTGGMHVVLENTNIGMSSEQFLVLNSNVQKALTHIESAESIPSCISIHYESTTIAIKSDPFKDIAKTFDNAAARMDLLMNKESNSQNTYCTQSVNEQIGHTHHITPQVRLN
tara:strand:+ start:328 stop:714 length:387 start_codon:yes stop_codon:yes gene_type:complete